MNSFEILNNVRNEIGKDIQVTCPICNKGTRFDYDDINCIYKQRVAEAIFKHSHGNIINKERFMEELCIGTTKKRGVCHIPSFMCNVEKKKVN